MIGAFKDVTRLMLSPFCPKKCTGISKKNEVHFRTALLCMVNRGATMKEHGCDEHGLFLHPSWLFKHYFENSGIPLTDQDKIEILRYSRGRWGKQPVQAFLCITNRYMTMREYGCSPESFLREKNHDCLIMHFIANGGAVAFAKRREKYFFKSVLVEEKL